MNVLASGRLMHDFGGKYRAVVVLRFSNDQDASLAQAALIRDGMGETWFHGVGGLLTWTGSGGALERIKCTLGSFGADEKKIDSGLKWGDTFKCTIPVSEVHTCITLQ